MAPPQYVTVIAPEGRRTPIDRADGYAIGGGPLFVTHEHVCRVRYSHTVIRSVGRGDLMFCNMQGSVVPTASMAAAPDDMLPIPVKKADKGGK